MMYFFLTLSLLEFIAIVICCYYLWKFSKIILRMEDEIENAIDVLDERYASISKVLEIPLFFDSPEIKKVVEDVKGSRDAILRIANSIGEIEEEKENAG